ncbi:MAG: O-antigen ligase family protein [Acidimicrobiia bacterium]|nr:O-antigen ligase family protein [Acidimicrobiia bacterium]
MSVAAGALLVFTNGPVLLFSKRVLDRTGRWEDHAVWPVLAAAAACGVALAARRVLDATSQQRDHSSRVAAAAVGCFTLAAVTSTLWSVDPAATAWRSSVYAGMALLAWAIAGFDYDETAAVVAAVAGAAVAASLLLVWLRPDLGLHPDGNWKGVYTNRNSLAPLAAVGVLVSVRYLLASGGWRRVAAAGGVAAAVAALVGAGSRTAWISLAVAAVAATVVGSHHWLNQRCGAATARTATATAAGLATAATAVAVVMQWDVPTFSQRREIWGLVWDRILQRPVLGHGFFTFWDIEELTQHALLRRGSAHNSLVEVGLGLGLLGAVPFTVIVLLAARNATSSLWRHPGPDTWFGAALVAFLIVENLTESFVLWFSYSWVLLMAASLRPAPAAADRLVAAPLHRESPGADR